MQMDLKLLYYYATLKFIDYNVAMTFILIIIIIIIMFYVYWGFCFQAHCGVQLKPAAYGFVSLESLLLDMKDSIDMTYKGQGE